MVTADDSEAGSYGRDKHEWSRLDGSLLVILDYTFHDFCPEIGSENELW